MSKSTDTRRTGNLPPASKATTEAGKEDKGAAVRLAAKQNSTDGVGTNVIPSTIQQEEATAKAREAKSTGASNEDSATHKG